MPDRRGGSSTTDTTVDGADWEGRDLSGEQHARVAFLDVDLTDATDTGAAFTECTFRGARFNGSTHTDAAFLNCTFVGCSFFGARFTDCKLVGSTFERCTFDRLTVAGGNWSHVALPGADLRTASFRGTRLREADLTGARCQGASLRDLDLAGATLHGATLSGCDLRGSDVGALDPLRVVLKGTVVTYEQALALAAALGLDVRAE